MDTKLVLTACVRLSTRKQSFPNKNERASQLGKLSPQTTARKLEWLSGQNASLQTSTYLEMNTLSINVLPQSIDEKQRHEHAYRQAK